jgi:hypothetical protein
MLFIFPGVCLPVDFQEAVRVARTLKLGFTAAINDFGVPREEVLATWWSLMLIDELVAWSKRQPSAFSESVLTIPQITADPQCLKGGTLIMYFQSQQTLV